MKIPISNKEWSEDIRDAYNEYLTRRPDGSDNEKLVKYVKEKTLNERIVNLIASVTYSAIASYHVALCNELKKHGIDLNYFE